MLRIACLGVLFATLAFAQDARRHADGPDRGLPRDPLAFRPYHDDAQHPLNEVFRLLWLRKAPPAEVAATLPGEGPTPFVAGWVHKKRKGEERDSKWFGGDGRLLPLEELGADKPALLAALARVDAAVQKELKAQPELAVLFQHDLLRAAERMLDIGTDLDVVPALRELARAVALGAGELTHLHDPWRAALAEPAYAEMAARMPKAIGGSDGTLREVTRKSTRLFDAEKTLLWSRVFLAHPDGGDALAAMLPPADAKPGAKGPTVPIGFRAVLVQGVVAFDRDGVPHGTRMVFDVRTQELQNRDALSADNATWTHDGLQFGIWQLERQGVRRGEPSAFFRAIGPDDQDLFRDYGSGKHTTYRGQCSLCHRLSDAPENELAGFPVLRPHVRASFAITGDERRQLAEQQAGKLMARLRDGKAAR